MKDDATVVAALMTKAIGALAAVLTVPNKVGDGPLWWNVQIDALEPVLDLGDGSVGDFF